MGRPTAYDIKRGAVPDHGFSLDVVCEGLNPSVKPPVKVYFEGNSIQDGLLNLTGRGEAGVAQGVGISLTSSKGAALPFTQARALPWTGWPAVQGGRCTALWDRLAMSPLAEKSPRVKLTPF